MKRSKIVLIEWVDTGVIHGWQCHDDIEDSITHCCSVGFLIKKDSEGVTIAYAMSDQGLIMERKTIPNGCITRIRELRVR
ncbi:MAG: hypothetical protein V1709_06410 [Planctomycetota bacterium]